MGLAASLFYSTNADMQTLHRRVRPSEQQFEDQQERWNALADHLISELRNWTGLPIRTWLQGSYKFGTQIRPARSLSDEFDIDLGIYFEWTGAAELGEHEPVQLKDFVQASLTNYEAEDVIEVVFPPKVRCARIRYKGKFHIDVPAYHLDPDSDTRNLATQENNWEVSDPKQIYLWFKNKFDDAVRAQARRLIQYIKCWAALTFDEAERPSSILLTVLVAEAISNLPSSSLTEEDEAVAAIVAHIRARLAANPRVTNPVNRQEVLSNRLTKAQMDAFVSALAEFERVALAALDKQDTVSAADKWGEIFEHFFPMPAEKTLIESLAKSYLPVVAIVPEIAVRAVPKSNPFTEFTGTNEIGPIPKDCTIYFTVTNTHVIPLGANVYWIVRNEGEEAEDVSDLGHRSGVGLTSEQHSAYKGTHYMDCYVKRNGVLLGMRRVPVVISGINMPRRNPIKKPSYVRLRGRR